jgi:hypothetical protein
MWDVQEKDNASLVMSHGELSAPITKKAALTFAGRIVTLCGGEATTTNASRTATAPMPSGKGPKKKAGRKK